MMYQDRWTGQNASNHESNCSEQKHAAYLTNPELAGLSVSHNLDLYNDTQVEKFVRRVAEKLETGSIAITKAIADITGQLEQYRLTQLDKQVLDAERFSVSKSS